MVFLWFLVWCSAIRTLIAHNVDPMYFFKHTKTNMYTTKELPQWTNWLTVICSYWKYKWSISIICLYETHHLKSPLGNVDYFITVSSFLMSLLAYWFMQLGSAKSPWCTNGSYCHGCSIWMWWRDSLAKMMGLHWLVHPIPPFAACKTILRLLLTSCLSLCGCQIRGSHHAIPVPFDLSHACSCNRLWLATCSWWWCLSSWGV